MNYQNPANLLTFLGMCFFGDAQKYFMGLSEEERVLLMRQGKASGYSSWFYRYLYDILPENERQKLKEVYQANQIRVLSEQYELKRLCGSICNSRIRFAFIKGVDLAYRLYPDAALRRFCDWDVLIHPEDCKKALSLLEKNGWNSPVDYSHQHPISMSTEYHHHFAIHSLGHFHLEPHYTLPKFHMIDPLEIWSQTKPLYDGSFQHILLPEINLLMLSRHASTHSYFHADIPKLLCDSAVIISREKVDWSLLKSLSARWNWPYPGDLLAAFPEFFPPKIIDEIQPQSSAAAQFRKLFEVRAAFRNPSGVSIAISRFHTQGNVTKRLIKSFRQLTPNIIRSKYHLKKRNSFARLLLSYFHYCFTRTGRSLYALIRQDHRLLDYCSLVETIEASSRKRNYSLKS